MGNLKSRRCLIEAIESRLLLNGTIYVDANATGDAHDGTSWPSAYVDLQQALAAAVAGDEIHVAAGVYKPTSTNDRNILFRLNNGVALLGGYAGDQAANPNERDLKIHPTILSGDIGIPGQSSDNSKTILANTLSDSSTVCDGFTVSGASGGSAAMTISNANPTITNCTFQQNLEPGLSCTTSSNPFISRCAFLQNSSSSGGGGMRITGSSSPVVEDCQFVNNSVTTSAAFGGGVYCSSSKPTLRRCIFQSNFGQTGGGGIYQISSSAIVADCQFIGNTSVSGGGVYNSASNGTFTGCTFTGNAASGTSFRYGGGAIADFEISNSSILNCAFIANYSAIYAGAIYAGYSSLIPSTPLIQDCVFTRNVAGSGLSNAYSDGGAIYGNASIDRCKFNGNSAHEFGAVAYAIEITNSTFVGNFAASGGAGGGSNISNCTFAANVASEFGGALYVVDNAVNDIFWRNSAKLNAIFQGVKSVTYSDIQGGYQGVGNIKADPLFFRNPDPGIDGSWGTADDDYGDLRLRINSPVIDAGNSSVVPASADIDLEGNKRFWDIGTVPDTGIGPGQVVDMGAYEVSGAVAADTGGPYYVAVGDTQFHLRGFGISHADGIQQYEWDWNSDGLFDDAVGSTPTFPTAGRTIGDVIPIALRVTDSVGKTYTATSSITIVEPTIAVDAGPPRSFRNGVFDSLSAMGSTNVSGGLTYKWDLDADGDFDDAIGATIPYPLDAKFGSHVLAVQARNAIGQTAVSSTTISVVPAIIYVDAHAKGAGNGASWGDAYTSLSKALDVALNGCEVHVATGTYKPTTSNDRLKTFQLKLGVPVYGGYEGLGAPSPDYRNPLFYPTILSGDIGVPNDKSDNSFHVVTADLSIVPATYGSQYRSYIEGFIITGGNADGTTPNAGGIYGTYVTVRGCTFVGNSATNGGALYGVNGDVFSCVFIGNSATMNGGAIEAEKASSIANCTFLNNSAGGRGGAVYFVSSATANSIFRNNTATEGAPFYIESPTYEVVYSDIQGLAGGSNIDADPLFMRNPSAGADQTWGTGDDDFGDLRLRYASPCVDSGSPGAHQYETDLTTFQRVNDARGFSSPYAVIDMGAYERYTKFADGDFLPDAQWPAIRIKFDKPINPATLEANDLIVTNLTAGRKINTSAAMLIFDPATNSATWSFSSTLPDGNYSAVLPKDVFGDAVNDYGFSYDFSFEFFALGGDANRDRKVDAVDLAILSANWQGFNKTFLQGDFNYDGTVDSKDLAILSSNWQRSLLPQPPGIVAAPTRAPVRSPARL